MNRIVQHPGGVIALTGAALFIFFVFIAGCKTDYSPTPPSTSAINEDDIADMIASSLSGSNSSNGLTAQIDEATVIAGGGSLSKRSFGEHALIPGYDTTIERHDTVGTNSYDFTFQYSYSFQNAGDGLLFQFAMSGFYATAFLSGADTAVGHLQLSGITSTDTEYTLNGDYSRAGVIASKVRNHHTFSSRLEVSLINVKILKTNGQIVSGTASISISGKLPNDDFFSYSATLVFTGSQSATLTVNSKTYIINLATGVAIPPGS